MSGIKFDRQSGLFVPDHIKMQTKGYGDAGASLRKRSLKGFTVQSGSPQEDIDWNNATMRQRTRMLYMAAPAATSAIRTNRTNVVGVGLELKSRVNKDVLQMTDDQAEAWQRKTEAEFALWANDKKACDATGVNDFSSIQQLVLVSWLMSGDNITLFKHMDPTPLHPYGLRLHVVEADRVSTPHKVATVGSLYTRGTAENGNRIYDGVEIDKDGAIVAYHIRNTYPNQITLDKTEWVRVEAYGEKTDLPNVAHIMDSERPEQYRGVSYLAQVIEPLLQLRRYTESELTAAVVESFFTAFVKTMADPTGEMPFNTTGEELPPPRRDEYDYEMGPGQVNVMLPGEDVTFADPKRPNNGFTNFTRTICVQIGAALEIPADLLLKEFNASYSASRAALLEAWKAFKMRRVWFVNDLIRPTYAVWMAEAVARGRISAPGFFNDPLIRAAYLGSEWIGPSQGQLDPVKEIQAEKMACEEGFSTREQSTIRLNGGQWDANADQLKRENAKLAEAKVALGEQQNTSPIQEDDDEKDD